jgi:hypothetical protein
MTINHDEGIVKGKFCLNGTERFWSFTKERLMNYQVMI